MRVKVLQQAGKGALLAIAVSMLSTAVEVIKSQLWTGMALIAGGIAILIVYAQLVERQAVEEALKRMARGGEGK